MCADVPETWEIQVFFTLILALELNTQVTDIFGLQLPGRPGWENELLKTFSLQLDVSWHNSMLHRLPARLGVKGVAMLI